MKSKIILIIFSNLILFLNSCNNNDDELYFNTKYKIVSIQGDTPWRQGKFQGTKRQWLLQSFTDTTKHCLWSYIPDSIYFNKEIGDTAYFDYIRKDRFFIIAPKK